VEVVTPFSGSTVTNEVISVTVDGWNVMHKSIEEGRRCKDRKELCLINRVEYAHVESDLQLPPLA
jgi:hypothetical protein